MSRLPLFFFIFFLQSLYGQKTLDLKYGDTISYPLNSGKPAWVSVWSDAANIAFSLFRDGKKIKDQDDSKGIRSLERLYLIPEKNKIYTLKIWAKSYVGQAGNTKVKIAESGSIPAVNNRFTSAQLLEDLKTFRSIREKANAGLYLYRNLKQIDSIYHRAEKETENCKSLTEFYRIIARLTEFEGSCHNFTDLPNHTSYYLTQKPEYLPITLKNINGRLLQDSEGTPIPLSAEILSVNDVPAADIIRRFARYYSSDGYSSVYKETAGFEKGMADKFYIEFGLHKNYEIKYQWEGRVHRVNLPGISFENVKKLQESRHSLIFSKKLMSEKYALTKETADVYRLSLRGFDFAAGKEDPAYKKFSDFLDRMMQTLEKENIQHLIIDLRVIPGAPVPCMKRFFPILRKGRSETATMPILCLMKFRRRKGW